ncbi:hypothetical protein R1flu_009064 [Riccia fluitans]|uniref:Uncharacterized protein n=1 Tax=Riccia fluitans TaxID=41844 RepID=A0ABD1Z559_9MARC
MMDLPDAKKETQRGGQHSVEISYDDVTGEAFAEPLTFTQADQDISVPASSGVDIPGYSGGDGEEDDRPSTPKKNTSDEAVPNKVKDSLANL